MKDTIYKKVIKLVEDYQWDSANNHEEAKIIAKKIHIMYRGINPYSKFKKIHCLYNQHGLNSFGKQRYGYVIGESRNGKNWLVKWNENKNPTSYHKDFIQLSK